MVPENICGLNEDVQAKIRGVFAKFPLIKKAKLYGSRATAKFRKGSNIDISLDGAGLTLLDLAKINIALDDLMLPYKIDLSLFHDIDHQDLREHILLVGISIYP